LNGRQQILFVNPPSPDPSALDLGLTYLATYINETTGHRARILDLVWHRRDWRQALANELSTVRPDWVGISTNKLYLPYVRDITKECHQQGYDVVIGGHQASVDPTGSLAFTGADACCTGDGETSFVPMLNGSQERQEQRVWRGSFIRDLDSLPVPDFSLWKHLDRYYYLLGSQYMIGSRGCPYRCSFCDAHEIAGKVGGRYFRIMGPDRYAHVLAELKVQHNVPMFQLFDPVFTIDPQWVRDFAASYSVLAKRTPYSVFARIDQLDEKRVIALASSGCKVVRVGIEAGNDYIRNSVYGKHLGKDKIRKVVSLCKRYRLAMTGYFILGGPSETSSTVEETIAFARELNIARTVFFVYKVLTNEGRCQMRNAGAKLYEERSDNITFGAVADLPGLPAWRTELYQKQAYALTFSNRLARLLRAQGPGYAFRFVQYMAKGIMWGISPKYLIPYFNVYGGPNSRM